MKNLLKLTAVVAIVLFFLALLSLIPGTREKAIDFGWLATIATVTIYWAEYWAARRGLRALRTRGYVKLEHPALRFVGRAGSYLLMAPAAAIVAAIVPGATIINPAIALIVLTALGLYSASVDGIFALIEANYPA